MIGTDKGFAAWVERQNPAIQITHYLHKQGNSDDQTFTTGTLKTMSNCIEIVNLIKAKALNLRIFSTLCEEMDISPYYFALLCVGFQEEKFSQNYLSFSAK